MRIEAVLLTGGASRRMGEDKASLLIDGVPQAERIALSLTQLRIPVTILGKVPVPGHAFLADIEQVAGPLAALSRFEPRLDAVFVCSCDLPLFDGRIVEVLENQLGSEAAAVPEVNGFRQPLCALYTASAFSEIAAVLSADGACPMRWLDALPHVCVSEVRLRAAGLDPQCAQGANTREEFDAMLASRPK